jgi:preprotein translocase subunit SecG
MSTELVFVIVMVVLAAILFGTVLLIRRRRANGAASSPGPQGVAFRDCYDLGATETGRSSESFKTICTPGGTV